MQLEEVTVLSRIHHRNLVPLIGYCEEGCQSILVYEYMHNGTLRDRLHDYGDQRKALDWISRLHIAEDAAKGLEYLHNGCDPSIIHRDVKSSNILLDIHMRAKVSDFGLSRMASEEMTHVSSVACGTVDYLDPEYYATQQLTEKSDIYSFGVVRLELISGRKAVSSQEFGADWNIVLWARSLIRKGDIHGIIDPALGSNFKVESLWKIAEIAILGVEPYGLSRPRMKDIYFRQFKRPLKWRKEMKRQRKGFWIYCQDIPDTQLFSLALLIMQVLISLSLLPASISYQL